MREATEWKDYELIDASRGEKLERWGDVYLIRPDPQVLWDTPRGPEWARADARYLRSPEGGGRWETRKKLPEQWTLSYGPLRFFVRPTGFKHTGLFPEQAVNWDFMRSCIAAANRPVRVLNLFAYTGGATLACLSAGASVCHVDAAKGMVGWARENAALSGLEKGSVRWLVDDCLKFIEREIRRENRYDAIVMDPPSYGRGPGGEVWKLEDGIYALCEKAAALLSDKPLFFLLNSYTTGLSASVMQYLLAVTAGKRGGRTGADEIGLPVTNTKQTLGQGCTAIWLADGAAAKNNSRNTR